MSARTKRKNIRILAVAACILAAAAGVFLAVRGLQERHRWVGHEAGTGPEKRPEYAQLALKKNIESFLVMGLDKFEADSQQIGYLNDQQADFLAVVVLDHGLDTCRILQLNRDTMTEIRRLGIGGKEAGTFTGQLALAHTYGSGGSDSCLNTVRAVSGLLDGIRIDHYLSMTMDAIAGVNDLVGGVTVTVEDIFPEDDPTFHQGDTVCLRGDQALRYVRARGGMEDSSNLARMNRQQQYMKAFYQQFMDSVRDDDDFFKEAWAQVGDSVQTDCTNGQIQELMDKIDRYELDGIYTLDGTAKDGKEFMEYYPDEAKKQNTIKELFFEPAE